MIRIKRVTLSNFRQHASFSVDLGDQSTHIFGNNTTGKSTLHEALFMLCNGYSPFTRDHASIVNSVNNDNHYRIAAEIETGEGTKEYVIFHDLENGRQLKVNGKRRSLKIFNQGLAAILFSPEIIEVLMLSSTKRRDLIDLYIGKCNPEHPVNIRNAKKALGHRNAHLKKLAKQLYNSGHVPEPDQQYEYWTDQFVINSSLVSKERHRYIKMLSNENLEVRFIESAELDPTLLEQESLNLYGDELTTKLNEYYRKDVARGYTSLGFHREDWELHTDKDIKKAGSRGEKRIAIIHLMMNILDMIEDQLAIRPVLLLDDLSSELDDENIAKLLDHAKTKVFSR